MTRDIPEHGIESMIREAAQAFGDPPGGLQTAMRARLMPRASVRDAGRPGRRHPIRRLLAGAVAACVVALVAWTLLSGHAPRASVYAELAEVLANSRSAEWLHGKGNLAGQDVEMWLSPRPLRTFVRHGEHVQGADLEAHRNYRYDPETQTLRITQIEDAPQELLTATSFLPLFLAGLERDQEEGGFGMAAAERVIDGAHRTVYTLTDLEDGAEVRIVVDPVAQRLLRMETESPKGPLGDGPFAIDFDYPLTGPRDIYAAGVPRDAWMEESLPNPDVADLYDQVIAARERFAPRYYAIIFQGIRRPDGDYDLQDLTVIYRKGGRNRFECYALRFDEQRSSDARRQIQEATPPHDAVALEAWLRTRKPMGVTFSGPTPESEAIRIQRDAMSGGLDRRTLKTKLLLDHTVEDYAWLCGPPKTASTLLVPKEGEGGPLVGVEWFQQAHVSKGDIYWWPERRHSYWNPQRDFIREEEEWLADAQGDWQRNKDWLSAATAERVNYGWQLDLTQAAKHRESTRFRVTEYGKTPAGQWYPKVIDTERESNHPIGVADSITVIHLDTDRAIPDELFDPTSIEPAEDYISAP